MPSRKRNPLLDEFFRVVNRDDFRHGRFARGESHVSSPTASMTAAYHMATGDGDPDTLLAACSGSQKMASMLLAAARTRQTRDDIKRMGWSPDVAEMLEIFELFFIATAATEQDAREAFGDSVGKAHLTANLRKMAKDRHASKHDLLEKAWRTFSRNRAMGNKESATKFLAAWVKHYCGPDEPKLRTYQVHFTKRGKEEGFDFGRGRRPKTAVGSPS